MILLSIHPQMDVMPVATTSTAKTPMLNSSLAKALAKKARDSVNEIFDPPRHEAPEQRGAGHDGWGEVGSFSCLAAGLGATLRRRTGYVSIVRRRNTYKYSY